MNNYWETNYLAGQQGPTRFRYALRPHGPFDAAAAWRFGVERSQPLIPVLVGAEPPPDPPLRVGSRDVVVTSLRPSADGDALIVRLFNPSERPQAATLAWPDAPGSVWISSPSEDRIRRAADRLELPAWGIVTLRRDR
jgi:alpha-mannosidase